MATEHLSTPPTFAALIGHTVSRHPERTAMRWRDDGGAWQSLTWLEVGLLVVEATHWLELTGGPRRVSILADPAPAATVLTLAGLVAGCSVNPMYTDAIAEETDRLLRTVKPNAIVVGAQHADQLTAIAAGAPVLDLDAAWAAWRRAAAANTYLNGTSGFEAAGVVGELSRVSQAGEQRRAPSLLLQSSGTTGPAKVIELSASAALNATWAVRAAVEHHHPRFLAFLPSGHISHQLINVFAATLLAGEVWYGGGVDTLIDDLRATKPTVLFGSPLLYREVRRQLDWQLGRSAVGRRVLKRLRHHTDRVRTRGFIVRGHAPALGRLVGWRAARSLGLRRAQEMFSGTSPLDGDTHAFFASLGWYVRNTYGVSECGGAATISARDRMAVGELGRPVEGTRVRLVDGEIELHAASMMNGFLDGDRLAADGWLATGDLGAWSAEGALEFCGRRSSVVATAHGRTTLDAVEARVEAAFPGISAVVQPLGRGRYALFVFDADGTLTSDGMSSRAVSRFIQSGSTSAGLDSTTHVAVVSSTLSAARGEIGPTGKVRRWRVAETWLDALEPIHDPFREPAEAMRRERGSDADEFATTITWRAG